MSHLSMIILAQVNSEKKRQNGSKRIAIGNNMGVIRKHAAHSPILSDLKTIYQAADEQKALAALDRVTEKWTATIRNWAQVYGELSIMYEGRLPE